MVQNSYSKYACLYKLIIFTDLNELIILIHFQGYLYLGLALMSGFILYDTQLIMEKRRAGDKDFIAHSVDLFVDFIGVFRRLLIILAQKV